MEVRTKRVGVGQYVADPTPEQQELLGAKQRTMLRDAAPGEVVYMQERIGDDKNSMEVRETFYLREDGRDCWHPHNVPIARLAVIQGDPGSAVPRYVWLGPSPCRDPGEADGRVSVGDWLTAVRCGAAWSET